MRRAPLFPSGTPRALGTIALIGLNGCALVLDYGDYRDATGGGGSGGNDGGTGGAGGGPGGTGGIPSCSEGESLPCYSGPDGTEGIGACQSGLKTCNAQSVFCACEGEVLPSAEIVLNETDEDCTGSAAARPIWTTRFGDAADQVLKHLAVDGSGNVLLAGSYQGVVDLGNGKVLAPPAAAAPDMFVAKLSAEGVPLWIQGGGGPMLPRSANGVTVGSGGSVIVAGSVVDPSVSLVPEGFVMQFAANGAPGWLYHLGGDSASSAEGVRADPSGAITMIGRYRGTLDFPDGPRTSAGGGAKDDVLVVRFDAGGNPVWSRSIGADGDDIPWGVAVHAGGEVFVTGEYRGAPAGLPPAEDNGVPGLSAPFVLRLDTTGAVTWKQGFPAASLTDGNARGQAVALDAEGAVWVTGAMFGDSVFGQGAEPLLYAGMGDVFVARLEPTLGEVLWAKSWGDGADQRGTSIAIAEDGAIFVAGVFSGSIDFDESVTGDELTAQSGQDMFVVKLNSNGGCLWSARFALGEAAGPRDVRLVTHGGDLLFGGGWMGGLDFGSAGTSAPNGGLDAFAARLSQ